MRQSFTTLDAIRLDIEDEPEGFRNVVENPNGDLGGFGWVTPVEDTVITGVPTIDGTGSRLQLSTGTAQPVHGLTDRINVTSGRWLGASFNMRGAAGDVGLTARWEFRGLLGELLSTSAPTAFYPDNWAGKVTVPSAQAPAGTSYVQLRLDLKRGDTGALEPVAGTAAHFGAVTIAIADTNAFGSSRRNKVLNPSFGDASLYGYNAVNSGTYLLLEAGGVAGPYAMRVKAGLSGGWPLVFNLDGVENVTPGKRHSIQFHTNGLLNLNVSLQWFDAAGQAVTGLYQAAFVGSTSGAWQLVKFYATPPTNAAKIRVQFDTYQSPDQLPEDPGQLFDGFLVEQTETHDSYFDGTTANADGYSHTWAAVPHRSASIRSSGSGLDYIEPIEWLSILGTAHTLTVKRDALDVGSLTANIADTTLDPAKSAIIRPGRRIVLWARDPAGPDMWDRLFTGYVQNARVEYDLKSPNAAKRARIELNAVDNTTTLANVPRADGVGTIAELPAVLEGAGVPWCVNGSGDQVPTATIVARNESASALDQVGITRDSAYGFAWIDRQNALQVWDRDQITTTLAGTFTDADYVDLAVDYDTERCINYLTLVELRINPATGETEEVRHGPYVDQISVDEWGPRTATMTVQGIAADQLGWHALGVLDRNGTPQVRVNSLTFRVRDLDELSPAMGQRRAMLDLLDLVRVTNDAGALDAQLRVQGITHTITAKRWTVQLDFSTPEQVASPNESPSPPPGKYGQTLAELLRPVGEVTMWWGSGFAVPPGWLRMDGSTFDSAQYPRLFEYLGTNVLPNMSDRVPVGASLGKTAGDAGGSELKSLPAHYHDVSMPDHEHWSGTLKTDSNTSSVTRQNGTNANVPNPNHSHTISGRTGNVYENPSYQTSDGGSATLDVMQPWRAMHFIIRAA